MKFLHASNPIPNWQAAEAIARQRHATLQRFIRLQKRHSVAESAALVGASVPTLWRWQKRFAARGLAGLKPKPASGGRRSPFSKIRFPVKVAREIERLIVATGHRRAAWRQFAGSPLCPPSVARHIIQTGIVPMRLAGIGRVNRVQAICYLSADGRRLLIRLPCRGAITTALAVPAGFKLCNPTKAIFTRETSAIEKELQLQKQILSAEKAAALAKLESRKDQIPPEQYAAARAGIEKTFGGAELSATERARNRELSALDMKAFREDIQSKQKKQAADNIYISPEADDAQRGFDQKKEYAEQALKNQRERIALIDRMEKAWKQSGLGYQYLHPVESEKYRERYGVRGFDEARQMEEASIPALQGDIERADQFRESQKEKRGKKAKLESEAGTLAGQRDVDRGEFSRQSGFVRAENATDEYAFGQTHPRPDTTAAKEATVAAQKFVQEILGGYRDLSDELEKGRAEFAQYRYELKIQASRQQQSLLH